MSRIRDRERMTDMSFRMQKGKKKTTWTILCIIHFVCIPLTIILLQHAFTFQNWDAMNDLLISFPATSELNNPLCACQI